MRTALIASLTSTLLLSASFGAQAAFKPTCPSGNCHPDGSGQGSGTRLFAPKAFGIRDLALPV